MTNQELIPVFTGTLNHQATQMVDARTLHGFLEVRSNFRDWIRNRIEEYGFAEDADYLTLKFERQVPHQGGTRKTQVIDYHLTLDTAKEMAMVERNDKGREARRYFIECERKLLEAKGKEALPHDRNAKPFQQVNPSSLAQLRRIAPHLAQAYLIECGVTPDYVGSLLANPNGYPQTPRRLEDILMPCDISSL